MGLIDGLPVGWETIEWVSEGEALVRFSGLPCAMGALAIRFGEEGR